MLAFIGNLSVLETLVVAILAVLVFGRRLPEVAVRVVRWFQGIRRSLDDLRRETGIDKELRDVERSFRDVAREAKVEDPLHLPPPSPPPRARSAEEPPAPREGSEETA